MRPRGKCFQVGGDDQQGKEEGVIERIEQIGGEGGEDIQRAALFAIGGDHLVNLGGV